MSARTEYTLDELSCLNITSPCIHMDGCRLPPECSLQNNNTTLVNSRDPSASEEPHPIAPYKFFGTRSICAITGTQYWQVKLVVQSAAVASLVNEDVFAEFGVVSSTALDAADSNTDGDFSVMVRHRLSEPEEMKTRILWTHITGSSTDRNDLFRLELLQSDGLLWTCGILVNSAMKRVTIIDTQGGKKLFESSFNDGKLYAAFNIFNLKDSVDGEIKLSVETGGQIRLSRELAGTLAEAVGSNLQAVDKQYERIYRATASAVAENTLKKTPSSNARTEPDLTATRTTADDQTSGRKRKDVASGEEREPGASGSASQKDFSEAGLLSTTSVPRAHTSPSAPTSTSIVEGRSQRGSGGEDTEGSEEEEHASTAEEEERKRLGLRKRRDSNEAGFQNEPAEKPKRNSSSEDS